MAKAKTMLGSGGVVVMDEDTCMVKAALRIMRFYAHESCGWCIPCREGTTWLRKMLHALPRGHGAARAISMLIGELAKNMLGRTFCPLGDAAAMPTIAIRGEVPRRIRSASERQAVPVRRQPRLAVVWRTITTTWLIRSNLTIDGQRDSGARPARW